MVQQSTEQPLKAAKGRRRFWLWLLPSLLLLLILGSGWFYIANPNIFHPVVCAAPAPPSLLHAQVHNGVVYAWSRGELSAMQAETGKQIWRIKSPQISTITIHNDIIYTQGPGIGAIRASNGEVLWTAGKSTADSPVIVMGETIYGMLDGKVAALRASDGQVLWQKDIGGAQLWAVDQTGVYITELIQQEAQRSVRVAALSVSDGATLWRSDPEVLATKVQQQQVFASLTLANDRLLVKTNQSLAVVQAQTGKALWSIPVQLKETEVYGSYAIAVVKETVYLGLRDTVSALRLENGEKIWSFSVPKSTIKAEQMLATNDGIYTQLDAVYAFQPDNGRVIWKNSQITLEDAQIADGIIYAKQYKPFLAALQASDGKVLWQIDKNPIENSVVGTLVDIGSGTVYTASSGYNACYDNRYAGLYAFRANDGSRSWNYIDKNV